MNNQLGKVTRENDGFQVRFERVLKHDIQTVWDAITNPEKLKLWFTDIEMDFKPGGTITIRFRDAANTPSYGKIVRAEPPHVFAFTWEDELAVWELAAEGKNQCRLTLTYSKVPDSYAINVPAGFHTLLDRLERMLGGYTGTYAFGAEEKDPDQQRLQALYRESVENDFPGLVK